MMSTKGRVMMSTKVSIEDSTKTANFEFRTPLKLKLYNFWPITSRVGQMSSLHTI